MTDKDRHSRKNLKTGLIAGGLAIAMVGVGFAAVPLYRIFCQVTGFGGTTMRVDEAQAATVKSDSRQITIRFDANHRDDLPWTFQPEKPTEKVTLGQRDLAIYLARNLSSETVTGSAIFNVTPTQAGQYFNKIQCFCFTEQTLKPGEEARMPVVFFVDPEIMNDPDTRDIEEITLSYTFFPVDTPNKVDPADKGS